MNTAITSEQVHTAKEIFPSLFLQYSPSISDNDIAKCIFENNFDSAIVSRSLERKVWNTFLTLIYRWQR